MGGAGKTTLARLVYNDESIEQYFESRIWVHVSNDLNIRRLLKDVIESITRSKCDDPSNFNTLVEMLLDNLRAKKYLLVLDDMWNRNGEGWARLKEWLSVGALGSKIIITTRIDDVAKMVGGNHPIYKLDVLKEDDCWSIFQKLAFGAGGAAETPTLRDIGKEMVKKCGGLPLAAKTLGSLMHSKKEEQEWRFMRDNEIRNIPEDGCRILSILKLSYNHLPSPLKQCFSYCAIFPKNQRIERKTLIQLWMAEGFIHQLNGNDKLLEDIGNDYFNRLLRNSLFQNVEKDNFEEITTCKMHNLVHELAQDVAGTPECLIVEASKIGDISQVRRLRLLNFDEAMSPRVSKALRKAKKLRTLFLNYNIGNPMTKNIIKELFKNNRRLRVLDLSGTDMQELPASIGKLKHLRYLDLSYTNIEELPDSISELYSLQTLKLRKSEGFIRLPKNTNKLINLRHLINSGIIPRHLGQLTCLQTIQEFRVCDVNEDARGVDGYGLEELGSLNSLGGNLTIHGLESFQGNAAQRANLKGKSHLRSLSLEWGLHLDSEPKNQEMVLEALQPHPHLKSLCIECFGGAKLPAWMGFSSCLPNLLELTLRFIHGVEQLPSLGELPLLKILVIEGMSVTDIGKGISRQVTSKEAFPSLKELTLKSMIYLESFSSFPHLEKLEICECPCLKVAPTYFPSLKELLLQDIKGDMTISSMVTRNIMSLTKIEISKVAELKYLPQGLLQNNSTLRSLEIDSCPIFEGFICEVTSASGAHLGSNSRSSRSNNSSLESLELRRCPVLRFLPDLQCFTSLRILMIFDCKELIQSLPFYDLKKLLPSLELLCLDNEWTSWSRKYEDYGI